MNMNKLFIPIITLTIIIAGIQEYKSLASEKGPFAIFFAVHMEAWEFSKGKYQEQQWPNLVKFVEMADRYGAKLTLMFNPQWAQYLLEDKVKFNLLKVWQKNGHEVALHYHNIYHRDWNGYTNRKDKKYTEDLRYRGTVDEMMKLMQKLATPDKILTMCMGPEKSWDSTSVVEIDEIDYPQDIIYDADGVDVGLNKVLRTEFRGRKIFHLKHHALLPERKGEDLKKIQNEFKQAKSSEVLGVVTHEGDFGMSPSYIEEWFRFVRDENMEIRTVRDIVESYPKDEVIDKEYIPQKGSEWYEVTESRLFDKVRRLHELIREKKVQGLDTREAEKLDEESRRQAEYGNLEQTERLLDEAIRLLE